MKKIILLILVLTSFSNSFSQSAVCGQFHKNHCKIQPDGTWQYNTQSRSGLFTQGETSKIRFVLYKDMDYKIFICAETATTVDYKIVDLRNNELLFDSKVAKTDVFTFKSTGTRSVVAEVMVPKGKTEADKYKPSDAACVGIMILYKPLNK